MKQHKRKKAPPSEWENLAWKRVDVKSSSNNKNNDTTNSTNNDDEHDSDNDIEIDDSKFHNSKNHYDDPKADPSELYNDIMSSKYDHDAVEGADAPGIFVGLEVIDGSQYQVEKIKVGKGASAGYITRLVVDGDDKDEGDDNGDDGLSEKSKGESAATKKKSTNKQDRGEKDQSSEHQKKDADADADAEEPRRQSRKERYIERLKAKRLERKAEKKRKRELLSSTTNTDTSTSASNSTSNSTSTSTKPEKKPKKEQNQNPKEDNTTSKKKRKRTETKSESTKTNQNQDQPLVSQEDISTIQNSWSIAAGGIYLHDKICSSLHSMQFSSPTPIQASTLAAAILGQRDIVGAAPTGSGKTLSYLLPILQYLLSVEDERKDVENTNDETPKSKIDTPLTALILCPTRELAMQVSNEYSKLVKSTVDEPYHNRIKCGSIVGGLSEQKQKRILNVRRPPLIVGTPGRLWDLMSSGEHAHLTDLTKLRFLVIDEADRMVNQGSFPQLSGILGNIRSANPSPQDMLEEDTDSEDDDDEFRLRGLPGIRGEAKVSMLNDDILKMIQQQSQGENPGANNEEEDSEDEDLEMGSQSSESSDDDEIPVKRQTFIFSATLTLSPSAEYQPTPSKSKKGKKGKGNQNTVDGAIAEILEKVGAQGQTKTVDLSNDTSGIVHKNNGKQKDGDRPAKKEFKLPPGLSLYEIQCTQRHKDSHLYSFLTTTKQGSSGPCLVFCNSVAAVKRVGETMKTLGLPARTLHAQMQQKSRMSAVESLTKANSRSIVIATDVAARGLDIPSVATVIHYDVPRAADLFVHRAGRTARGMGKDAIGWSVSLVSAPEEKAHQHICGRVLGLGTKCFDTAPMDGRLLSGAQERVNLASKIVACADSETRTNKKNQWFIDAAKEADLDLDDNMLDEGLLGGNNKERQSFFAAKKARQQLKVLLAIPMRTQTFGKFLSGAGVQKSIQTALDVKPFVVKPSNKSKSKTKKVKK